MPTLASPSPAPPQLLHQQPQTLPAYRLTLHPRDPAVSPMWDKRIKAGDAATINLSRDFSCLITHEDGSPVLLDDVGRAGVTLRRAWDMAASELVSSHSFVEGTEFFVRDSRIHLGGSTPRGFEVSCQFSPAAAWLAHPRAFRILHTHMLSLLSPREGLVYLSSDQRELFVLDAPPARARGLLDGAAPMEYVFGFPVLR